MKRTYDFLVFMIILLIVSSLSPLQAQTLANALSTPILVDDLPQVTALAFTPDQAMLFAATKDGKLYAYDVDSAAELTRRAGVVLNISSRLCEESERGLLGIAIDPAFATNRYLYMFYTYDKGVIGANRCIRHTDGAAASAQTPVNRVSRFTLGVDGLISMSTEKVLVDNILSNAGNHNAGDLHFGKDGYLYISTGDGGCDYAGSGCGGGNNAARDIHMLLGKILRINPNPANAADRVPATNPFASSGVTCALVGTGTAGKHCRETYAYGLRNPFRMAFDPNASGTRFFINDVGQNSYEELNLGEAGVDYRWNICEGLHVTNSSNLCPAPVGQQRHPIHEYAHNEVASNGNVSTDGCTSITAAAFVPNGVWLAEYDNAYLFSDYVCGKTFALIPNASQGYTRELLSAETSGAVDLDFGPGPGGPALYIADIVNNKIIRIILLSGANNKPNAIMSASPRYGSLTVNFDASGSSDPNGDSLVYEWDFGDGQSQQSLVPTLRHTYSAHGSYTATLRVRDIHDAFSRTVSILIQTDNTPPNPTIELPTSSTTFKVGQTITLRGRASDAQDGTVPDTGLVWTVILHHRADLPGDHTHPFLGPIAGNNLTFEAPAPEDLDAASNSYLEVRLMAIDRVGAESTISRNMQPKKVLITLLSDPTGRVFTVNDMPIRHNESFISWEGYALHVGALPQQDAQGSWLALKSWQSSTETGSRTIITPNSATSYTAIFGEAEIQFLSVIAK